MGVIKKQHNKAKAGRTKATERTKAERIKAERAAAKSAMEEKRKALISKWLQEALKPLTLIQTRRLKLELQKWRQAREEDVKMRRVMHALRLLVRLPDVLADEVLKEKEDRVDEDLRKYRIMRDGTRFWSVLGDPIEGDPEGEPAAKDAKELWDGIGELVGSNKCIMLERSECTQLREGPQVNPEDKYYHLLFPMGRSYRRMERL